MHIYITVNFEGKVFNDPVIYLNQTVETYMAALMKEELFEISIVDERLHCNYNNCCLNKQDPVSTMQKTGCTIYSPFLI